MNYRSAYVAQLQGRTFYFRGSPSRLYIFGPVPHETAIIIRTTELGAEADYSPEDVWNKILTLEWILN